MNIPIGKIEEAQIRFSDKKPLEKTTELMQSGFDGYLVATIEGVSGLEEGLLMVKGQEVVGVVFDAMRVHKQLHGLNALRLVLHIFKARQGIFDVNRLSRQQIDLIMAFNEKIRLPKAVGLELLSKLAPKAYDSAFVSKELAIDPQATESRGNLLKKMGLGSI